MCGIFGYLGNGNAPTIVLNGLKRLEYRGYDSWGIAVQNNSDLTVSKDVGELKDPEKLLEELQLPDSNIAIGHTRWATHGRVNQTNAHPHFSTDKSFALAHNGIVGNADELKQQLQQENYQFNTETDTEVIVRLIEKTIKENPNFSLKDAVQLAFKKLKGRNTVVILPKNQQEIIAARNGSPLIVGLSQDETEIFISSDTLSFAPYANKMVVLDNNQLIHAINQKYEIYDLNSNNKLQVEPEILDVKSSKVDKEGYDHFMIKEIHENPQVVVNVTRTEQQKLQKLSEAIKSANHVYTIGSGTAGLSAAQLAFYLRNLAGIQATYLVGADAQEYFSMFQENDLLIAPSQSGETADVLEVLEIAKQKGAKIASYVNMSGSAMLRMSDFPFHANSGPEICVMSTKFFVSQLAWAYLVAKTVQGEHQQAINNLQDLSEKMQQFLGDSKNIEKIKQIAEKLKPTKDIFLLGKAQNLQIINEGMVKLIEGTYKHAHAIPAGDLKHYAITLMEDNTQVIAALSNDDVKDDVLNAIHEVRARGAKVLAVSNEDNNQFDDFIIVPECGETSAIMNVVPLQLLSYYLTVLLGNNVDKPRNIAKSVTVK